MIKAVIFDVGGTLLGARDLLENILAGNPRIKAHDDIYNQLGNEFFRQVADCSNGSTFKKVVELIAGAIEAVNRENNNCLASVNPEQVYWNTFVNDSFVINDADTALEKLNAQKIELFVASDADAELIYAQFEKHNMKCSLAFKTRKQSSFVAVFQAYSFGEVDSLPMPALNC